MSVWPGLLRSRTVRAGSSSQLVVRCSVMDTMMASLSVSVVFFYPGPLDENRLAGALATALRQVPVFAGRLRTLDDGQLTLVCDDSGVPLDSYQIDETLAEAIARMTLRDSGYVDHVDAPAARAGGQPLLTIRLTQLADGASALGCSWHHAVGDVQSFMLLMQAWSAAFDDQPVEAAIVLADPQSHLIAALPETDSGRVGFRLPDIAETESLQREIARAPLANRTVQVYFSTAEVARLREDFTQTLGRRLSVNDVLCAHVVSGIRELNDDHEARNLAMPVNVRRPLGLPASLVGNLVNEIFFTSAAKTTPEALAGQIRDAVDNFATAHLNLRSNLAFLNGIDPARHGDCVPIGFDPVNQTFTMTNWTRFGLYDVAFGAQRPVFFSPAANLQLPWIGWLVEGFDNDGCLLTVVAPSKLASKIRGEAGAAVLHRYRSPDETLPALATQVRKLG